MKLDIWLNRTPTSLHAFAHGTEAHDSELASWAEAYDHSWNGLQRFPYERLNRAELGMLRVYLQKSASFSRAQLTRLITQYRNTEQRRDGRCATT